MFKLHNANVKNEVLITKNLSTWNKTFNALQEVESSRSKLVLTIKCLGKYFNVFVLPKLALKNVIFISKCFAVERYTTFLTQKKLLLNETESTEQILWISK